MKTVYLIRHAKSDWSIGHLSDIDRPLNERGYRDAHKMSFILKNKKIIPDLIISSPAVRAISTALIFSRTLNYDPKTILLNKNLYDTTVKDYLKCISETDDQFQNIFLFGHNPTISNTAHTLCNALPQEMPTSCISGISADVRSWKQIDKGVHPLSFFDYPKNNP